MIATPDGLVPPLTATRMTARYAALEAKGNQGAVGRMDNARRIFQREEFRCLKGGQLDELDALRRSQFAHNPSRRGTSGSTYAAGWGFYCPDGARRGWSCVPSPHARNAPGYARLYAAPGGECAAHDHTKRTCYQHACLAIECSHRKPGRLQQRWPTPASWSTATALAGYPIPGAPRRSGRGPLRHEPQHTFHEQRAAGRMLSAGESTCTWAAWTAASRTGC